MKRRLWQLLVATVAVVVAVVAVEVVVHLSDGDFSGDYTLTGSFSQAGSGLQPDAEVVYRGVQVGRVSAIALRDGRAQVGMLIDPGFHVPADAVATIEPINVFGADQVSLGFPAGDGGRSLAPGSTLAHTAVEPGLDSLFAAAAPLLAKVDTTDLSTVIANLAEASDGEGPTIRASVDEGAKLAAFLDETLPAQITALDSAAGFAQAIAPTAPSINAISGSENELLPVFNANSAAYRRLLATVTPFADNLAQFLSAYHPDIETLLDQGDDVARLLLTDQQDIGTLISGLAIYEGKIGSAVDPAEVLPNGTTFAYFDAFLTVGDLNQLICGLLDPSVPGLSFLAPLQQALTGAGTPLQCGSTAATPTSTSSTPAPTSTSAAQAAQNLSNQLYGAAAQPVPASSAGSSSGTGSSGMGSSGTTSSGTGSSGTGSGGSSGSGSSGSSGDPLQQLLGGFL